MERTDLTGSDMARWTGLSASDKRNESMSKPGPEKEVNQEMRQTAYDNWETTDDHGMLIGIAKDQTGKSIIWLKTRRYKPNTMVFGMPLKLLLNTKP